MKPEYIEINHATVETKVEPKQNLDLAIIILNYNTAFLLADCLASLFASQVASQDDFRYQVCVVDNASSDESVAMLRQNFSDQQYADLHLIVNDVNVGYTAGNNIGLQWFGFTDVDQDPPSTQKQLPRYLLLLNPDTVVPPHTLNDMIQFMDANPKCGGAGPRVRLLDGRLDLACRRSFPTPQVSFYRMTGLSRFFPNSRRFNAYNLTYLPEDGVYEVDSVVGAYMQVRSEAIVDVGLMDQRFFMYGDDLDWAKRIKDAGWEIWYNGETEITHVKEAASSQSNKSRVDFHEAMWLFYSKHYRSQTSWLMDKIISMGIVLNGGVDMTRRLWRFCAQNR